MEKKKKVIRANDRLKSARLNAGLTRERLADEIGVVNSDTISRWEKGQNTPRPHFQKELCGFFQKSPQDLGLVPDEIVYSKQVAELSLKNTYYRDLRGLPPSTDSRIVIQREGVIKDIYEKLIQKDTNVLVLTGVGGIGKSTLAALTYHYAEKMRSAGKSPFTEETLWLKVDAKTTMTELASNLFEIFGQPIPDFQHLTPLSLITTLFTLLSSTSKPRLIVLDQFEELLETQNSEIFKDYQGVKEWLDTLNSYKCNSRFLLTSRYWRFMSPPMYLQRWEVPDLTLGEGVELLRKQGISPQQATDNELQKAVRLSNGHALALNLLALLLTNNASLNIQHLFTDPLYASRWANNIADELLDRIYKEQLSETQQLLLRAFSIYREAVPLDAVIEFVNKAFRTQLVSALETLLSHHLLQTSGEGRYRLHAIVSAYAIGQFDRRNKRMNKKALKAAHIKASAYYRVSVVPDGDRTKNMRLLVEAVWHLCQAEQYMEAYRLMEQEKVFTYLHLLGDNSILLELYQLMLPIEDWSQETSIAIVVNHNLGEAYHSLGYLEQGRCCYERMLQLCKASGDHHGMGKAFIQLGIVDDYQGEKEGAKASFEQALHVYESSDDRDGKSEALTHLAWIANYEGDKNREKSFLEEALQLCKDGDNRLREAAIFQNLGWFYKNSGNRERAGEYYEQALQIYKEVNDRTMEAWTLGSFGMLESELDHEEQAIIYFEAELKTFREIRNLRGEAWTLARLGKCFIYINRQEKARSTLEEALSLFQIVGDNNGKGLTFYNLGILYQNIGQEKQALEHYKQALAIQEKIKDFLGSGHTLLNIGLLFVKRERYNTAFAFFQVAKTCFEKVHHPDSNKAQIQIDILRKQSSFDQFTGSLAEVESHLFAWMEQIIIMEVG